ncbi:unnamed protein product [Gongylonema pulchrum]|uniref:Origin recognition complex subunit 2 winged-helix domain-containing protein n=1 Tax=Gongylonema pulchrum TaxID=637853 RepID=A0A3P6PCR0_9BILA|nr:unnamed protein product [Gongylonema pulchrum]
MQQHLSEFEDHRLITRKRLKDGNEYIWLTADDETIVEFLKEKGMRFEDTDTEDELTPAPRTGCAT